MEEHISKQNQNAAQVNREAIVTWFQEYVAAEGEATLLRRRRREMMDGGIVVRYDTEQYTLLSASDVEKSTPSTSCSWLTLPLSTVRPVKSQPRASHLHPISCSDGERLPIDQDSVAARERL